MSEPHPFDSINSDFGAPVEYAEDLSPEELAWFQDCLEDYLAAHAEAEAGLDIPAG